MCLLPIEIFLTCLCRHISPVFFLCDTLHPPKPCISPSLFHVFFQALYSYFLFPAFPLYLQTSFPYFSKPLFRISLGPSSAADHEQRLFCPTRDGKKFEDASSAWSSHIHRYMWKFIWNIKRLGLNQICLGKKDSTNWQCWHFLLICWIFMVERILWYPQDTYFIFSQWNPPHLKYVY